MKKIFFFTLLYKAVYLLEATAPNSFHSKRISLHHIFINKGLLGGVGDYGVLSLVCIKGKFEPDL